MTQRFGWVSLAALVLLTVASTCLAADGEPAYKAGKGGIGGQIGGSYFGFDRMFGGDWFGDYSEGAMPRAGFAAQFRYVQSRHWRWQVSPGFTWSAYKTGTALPFTDVNAPADRVKDRVLTLVVPITAQMQYVMRRGQWFYHAGAGPGLYRVWIENAPAAPRPVRGRHLRAGRRALPQVHHHHEHRGELVEPPGLHPARRSVPQRVQQQPDGDGMAAGRQLLLRPAAAEDGGCRPHPGQVNRPGAAARLPRRGSRARAGRSGGEVRGDD